MPIRFWLVISNLAQGTHIKYLGNYDVVAVSAAYVYRTLFSCGLHSMQRHIFHIITAYTCFASSEFTMNDYCTQCIAS